MKKIKYLLVLTVLFYFNAQAQQSVKNWIAKHGLTSDEYNELANKFNKDGFRLRYVDGYTVNGKVRFAAIWKKGRTNDLRARHFGYCLLGRIIQEESGSKNYEQYVKNKILKPCGITNMRIGPTTKEDRAYKEVVYYSSGNPYALKMRRMDSHGGWIASTIDLMRFVVRIDGDPSKRDILSKSSTDAMQSSSYSPNGIFGKGWDLSGTSIQHGGRMRGTRARLKCLDNGICYAYAVNKYSSSDESGGRSLNGAMVRAIEDGLNAIEDWSEIDLF